jgi:hypothetical protein
MKLKAGKYWIGDPCYVLQGEGFKFDWQEFCRYCFDRDDTGRKNEGVVDHQNIKFAYHGTASGDGEYNDQFGNRYGVDSGMIGCVPYDIISYFLTDKKLNKLGHIHEFREDFGSKYVDGVICFGDITISTNYEDYEDDENDEDYGDEEEYDEPCWDN